MVPGSLAIYVSYPEGAESDLSSLSEMGDDGRLSHTTVDDLSDGDEAEIVAGLLHFVYFVAQVNCSANCLPHYHLHTMLTLVNTLFPTYSTISISDDLVFAKYNSNVNCS